MNTAKLVALCTPEVSFDPERQGDYTVIAAIGKSGDKFFAQLWPQGGEYFPIDVETIPGEKGGISYALKGSHGDTYLHSSGKAGCFYVGRRVSNPVLALTSHLEEKAKRAKRPGSNDPVDEANEPVPEDA